MAGLLNSGLSGLQITKRNCFISYYHGDQIEVDNFVNDFRHVFTPVMLNSYQSYGTDIINSTNPNYVMQAIRSRHFGHSTVMIVLIGTCTHSRRYVDWEIKASLQRGGLGGQLPHGLIGIGLPSTYGRAYIPERLALNWHDTNSGCYARCYKYPSSAQELRSWIEDAFVSRATRSNLISNPGDMWSYNRKCDVCGVTH